MNLIRLFICCVVVSFSYGTYAQKGKTSQLYTPGNQTFVLSMNGQAMLVNKYANLVSGSPYLNDAWQDGKLITAENQPYMPLTFKLNLLDNTLHFRDSAGREMVSNRRIKDLVITNPNYGDMHFTQVDAIPDQPNSGTNVWVEVLVKGRATLYKYIRKQLVETRPYGSSTVEQRINDAEFYYMSLEGKMVRVKKVKEIVDAIRDKKSEMEQYVKTNKLSEKDAASFRQTIEFYNKLQ